MKSRSLIGMARALVAEHGGQVPASMDALVKLPGVGQKDRECRPGPRARRSRSAGRSPRAARRQSHRPRALRRCRGGREGAVRAAPARPVDARVRRADSSRASRLPAQAPVRPLPRAQRLRVLPSARREGPAARRAPRDAAMTRDEFRELVNEALEGIPQNFRDALQNIAIVVEDEPSPAQLERGRHRAARHVARTLRRHTADRTPVGARQHAARQDHALSSSPSKTRPTTKTMSWWRSARR